MGQTLFFYLVRLQKEHETEKPLCFCYNRVPEYYEVLNDVYERYTPEKDIIKHKVEWTKYQKFINDDAFAEEWCDRCYTMLHGFHFSRRGLLDKITVSHSYKNPLISSKFYIGNLHPGRLTETSAKYSSTNRTYYEITKKCIVDVLKDIDYRLINIQEDVALTKADTESLDESRSILGKISLWLESNPPDTRVFYKSPY